MKKDFRKSNLLLTLCLAIVLGFGYYLIIRNNSTLRFRNDLVLHIDDLRDNGYYGPSSVYFEETLHSVSYYRMFFSMKPLKASSFFSDETIAKWNLENY